MNPWSFSISFLLFSHSLQQIHCLHSKFKIEEWRCGHNRGNPFLPPRSIFLKFSCRFKIEECWLFIQFQYFKLYFSICLTRQHTSWLALHSAHSTIQSEQRWKAKGPYLTAGPHTLTHSNSMYGCIRTHPLYLFLLRFLIQNFTLLIIISYHTN